ncbi:MAG: lytic transglycosylase domain-containing protein [Rhizobiales bacterium]|nr:lytic transglycosylase domain-containing protein [Hyphomicrobiales bacterium]
MTRAWSWLVVMAGINLAPEAFAEEAAAPDAAPKTVCGLIEESAASQGIPVAFLTRLIWKESTFRAEAVSPKGAQGIAQFMPGTAALRALADPFDPQQAIPASAKYLKELRDRFGNLGLAAAAYNAGERRVADWLAGNGGLPWETRDYVQAITGLAADDWAGLVAGVPQSGAAGIAAIPREARSCLELAAVLAKPGAGAAPVADIPQAPWAPWGVQVAGNFSLKRALASYSALQRRYPAVIGSDPPMIVRKVNKSRGLAPLFQIRMPAQSQGEAGALCGRLQKAGAACVVMRN